MTLLLLSRLPVGLAKQTVTATRAVVSDLTPPDAGRSEALAKLFAGCSIGYAVGPYVGGLLADSASTGGANWLPALICASVFVALIPIVTILLPETSGAAPVKMAQSNQLQQRARTVVRSVSVSGCSCSAALYPKAHS